MPPQHKPSLAGTSLRNTGLIMFLTALALIIGATVGLVVAGVKLVSAVNSLEQNTTIPLTAGRGVVTTTAAQGLIIFESTTGHAPTHASCAVTGPDGRSVPMTTLGSFPVGSSALIAAGVPAAAGDQTISCDREDDLAAGSLPRDLIEQFGMGVVWLIVGAVATVLLIPAIVLWIIGAVQRGKSRRRLAQAHVPMAAGYSSAPFPPR